MYVIGGTGWGEKRAREREFANCRVSFIDHWANVEEGGLEIVRGRTKDSQRDGWLTLTIGLLLNGPLGRREGGMTKDGQREGLLCRPLGHYLVVREFRLC